MRGLAALGLNAPTEKDIFAEEITRQEPLFSATSTHA